MKEITFISYCTFGKGDSGESYVDVELTDEEYATLIEFGTQPDIYYNGFNKCSELRSLYDRIYDIAIKQMTEEMKDFGELDAQYLNDPDWKVDDLYPCGVNFPFEFEEMLVEDE